MELSTKRTLRNIKEYIVMTIGLFLYCFAWKAFLLPHEIVGGSVTGIAAIVYYATGISVSVTYFAINAVLLIASIIIIGWKFSVRSIYGVVVLTAFLEIMPQFNIGTFVSANDGFMACLLGGIIWGIGYQLIFMSHGSTGGTTIIAKIINKYSNVTLGRSLLYSNIIIICSSYFFLQNSSLEKVVYGLVTMAITTYVIDMIENQLRQSVQFFIFSKRYEQIANQINMEIGKGVTVIDGIGWYSKEPIKMITVIARKNESSMIFDLIKDMDPDAFISQSSVIGVYGKGFEKIE